MSDDYTDPLKFAIALKAIREVEDRFRREFLGVKEKMTVGLIMNDLTRVIREVYPDREEEILRILEEAVVASYSRNELRDRYIRALKALKYCIIRLSRHSIRSRQDENNWRWINFIATGEREQDYRGFEWPRDWTLDEKGPYPHHEDPCFCEVRLAKKECILDSSRCRVHAGLPVKKQPIE